MRGICTVSVFVVVLALAGCGMLQPSAGGAAVSEGKDALCVVYDTSGGMISCAPPADASTGDRCVCSDREAGFLYIGRVQVVE
jgi:hypothetical protein